LTDSALVEVDLAVFFFLVQKVVEQALFVEGVATVARWYDHNIQHFGMSLETLVGFADGY
jgi:hypothetical protein